MKDEIDFKIDGFSHMHKAVKKIFKDNLLAIFVHGSLFDGTFGKYSDFDIVVICGGLPNDVLERDSFAQKLKKALRGHWINNPFSFDFFTEDELLKSAENGHPFIQSVLRKGSPVYDPYALFSRSKYCLSANFSKPIASQMYKNLLFLSKNHYQAANELLKNKKLTTLAITEASRALTMLIRAKLIKHKANIYKGEIYQFFIKQYGNVL